MESKVWYKSKEAWLNLAALVSLALMLPEVGELVPGEAAKYVGALNAILNLVLRFNGNGSAPLTFGSTPKKLAILLAVVLPLGVAGCALKGSARHVAVVTDTTIHASLAALQDAEMALYRAGVPEVVAHHQAFNAQLVPALETGAEINRTIRNWPVDRPAPDDLPLLASRLQGLTRTIAANFPEGEAKSRLLTRAFAVSDVVLNLLLALPPARGAAPMLAPAR